MGMGSVGGTRERGSGRGRGGQEGGGRAVPAQGPGVWAERGAAGDLWGVTSLNEKGRYTTM